MSEDKFAVSLGGEPTLYSLPPKGTMTPPTVAQAERLCGELKARQVIVLAFDRANVAAASYGETVRECKQAGFLVDMIVRMLGDGTLPDPR